jgi:hypothetical protein
LRTLEALEFGHYAAKYAAQVRGFAQPSTPTGSRPTRTYSVGKDATDLTASAKNGKRQELGLAHHSICWGRGSKENIARILIR